MLNDSLAQALEYTICDLACVWRKVVNQHFKSIGITPAQRRLLTCVQRYPGITQVEIADRLEFEPQNCQRLLCDLKERGWIKKEIPENDKRARMIYLTKQSNKIMKEINALSSKIRQDIFADLNEKQAKQLTTLLLDCKENADGCLG